jgi:hypothetical protein
MTTPTVPQDVYLRHEREWQMLRQAIANSQSETEKKPAFEGLGGVREDSAGDTRQ